MQCCENWTCYPRKAQAEGEGKRRKADPQPHPELYGQEGSAATSSTINKSRISAEVVMLEMV